MSTYHRLQELQKASQNLEELSGMVLPLTVEDFNRRLERANGLLIPSGHSDFGRYNERGLPKTQKDYSRMILNAYYQGVEIPEFVRAYVRYAAKIPGLEEIWFRGSGMPLEPELKKPEDASSGIEAASLSIINQIRGRRMDVELYVIVGKSADFDAFIEKAVGIRGEAFDETHQEVLDAHFLYKGYLIDPLPALEKILSGAICVYPKG